MVYLRICMVLSSSVWTVPPALPFTLDICFENVPDACKAVCRLPLGRSDRNVIHICSSIRHQSERVKAITKVVQVWFEECVRNSLEDTVWDIFFKSCIDAHEITDTFSSYIKFCEELRGKILKAKNDYKNTIEMKISTGNKRQAWEGLLMGRTREREECSVSQSFANKLNVFTVDLTVRVTA